MFALVGEMVIVDSGAQQCFVWYLQYEKQITSQLEVEYSKSV